MNNINLTVIDEYTDDFTVSRYGVVVTGENGETHWVIERDVRNRHKWSLTPMGNPNETEIRTNMDIDHVLNFLAQV